MRKRFEDGSNEVKERAVDFEDTELNQALKDFKASVHAWSDAEYSRSRKVTNEVRVRSWRLAAGWALGCVLVAGSVGGGFYERHHRQELAKIAAERQAADQLKELQQQARARITDEALLSGVDKDVSRQVPDAMEPLAQMMGDDETK